jgi:hypothetical protein
MVVVFDHHTKDLPDDKRFIHVRVIVTLPYRSRPTAGESHAR